MAEDEVASDHGWSPEHEVAIYGIRVNTNSSSCSLNAFQRTYRALMEGALRPIFTAPFPQKRSVASCVGMKRT
ncbi:hypothetical protein NKDENANG_00355 [Candidatus Entotheonellaceae bacterium PAL068K]